MVMLKKVADFEAVIKNFWRKKENEYQRAQI